MLQVIVTISFLFLQMPHFLSILKGIKFSVLSIIIMVVLKTLEWINFIMIVCFVSALLTIVSNDLRKNNLAVLLIQLGKSKNYILRPMLYISFLFGLFAFLIDGFCVPHANFYLKKQLVEITKQHIITSLQPRHIVSYKEWNFAVQKRNNDELSGVLLNKENDPSVTVLIERAQFKNKMQNKKIMYLNLINGAGRVRHQNQELTVRFKSGKLVAPSSLITAHKTIHNLDLIDLIGSALIFQKLVFVFVSFCVPFFAFSFIYGMRAAKVFSMLSFVGLMLVGMNVLPFSWWIFFLLIAIIYLIYRRVVLC